MSFSILTVCTGNICRSPQAEELLRVGYRELASDAPDGGGVSVASAGTYAMVGEPMAPMAAHLLEIHGGGSSSHRARQLDAHMIETAQLVLCLTREHRKAVVSRVPGANRYTFTLKEFARLVRNLRDSAEPSPAALDLAGWTALAATRRGYFPVGPDGDDVVDPYGRDDATYQRSFDEILYAVADIVGSRT